MQAMRLDWQHACKGKGCWDKLCELCMHSPSRRCSSNTKPKYASGDHIRSTCEEAPDVVLLDDSGNRVCPARGSKLQITMLDDRRVDELLDQQGVKRDDKHPDGPLLSTLFREDRQLLNTCVADRPLLKWRSGSAVASVVLPFEGGSISLSSLQCVKPYKADPNTKQSGQTTKYHLWIQATDDQGSPLSTVSNHIVSDVFTLVTTRAKGAAKSIIPHPWEGVAMLDGLGRDAVDALRTLGNKVAPAAGLPEQLASVTKVKQFWQLVAWVNHAGDDSQARQQQLLKGTKIKQADFRNAADHVQRAAFLDYRPRVWWRPGSNNTAGLLFPCNNSEIQLSLGPIAWVVKRPGQPDELAAMQAVQLQHPAVQQAVQLAVQAWQQPGHGGSWGIYWSDAASKPWDDDADPWAEKALGPSLGMFEVQQLPAGMLAAAGVKQGSGAAAAAAVQPEIWPDLCRPVEQQQEQAVDELQQQQQLPGEDAAVLQQQQQQQQLMLQGNAWRAAPAAAAYACGNISSSTDMGSRHQQTHQQQQQHHHQLQQRSTVTQQTPAAAAAAALGIPATVSLAAAASGDVPPFNPSRLPAVSYVTFSLTTAPLRSSSAATLSTAAGAAAGAGLQIPGTTVGLTSRDGAEQQSVRYSRAVITEAPSAAVSNTAVQATPIAAAVQAVHTAAGQAVQVAAVQAPSSAAAVQAILSSAAAAAAAAIPAALPPGSAAAAALPGSFMALLASEGFADAAPAATVVTCGQMPMHKESHIADTAPGTAATLDPPYQDASTQAAAAAAAVVEQAIPQPVLPERFEADGACALRAAAAARGSGDTGTPPLPAAAGAGDLDAAAICAALRQAINCDDRAGAAAAAAAAAAVALDMNLDDLSGLRDSSSELGELLQFGPDLQSADFHLDNLLAGGSLFSDGVEQQLLEQLQQQGKECAGRLEGVTLGIQAAAAAGCSDTSKPAYPDSSQTRSLTRAFNSLNDCGSKPIQLRQPLTTLQQWQRQQQPPGAEQGREQQQQLEKKRDRQQRKAAQSAADKAYYSEEQQQQQQQGDSAIRRPFNKNSADDATAAAGGGGGEHAAMQEQPAAAADADTAGHSNRIHNSSLGLEGLLRFEHIINQGRLEAMASTDEQQLEQQQREQENEQQQQQQQQGWRGMGFKWSTPPGVSGPEDFSAAFPASLMGQAASYLSPVDALAAPSPDMLLPDEGEDLVGLSGLMSTLELEHAPPYQEGACLILAGIYMSLQHVAQHELCSTVWAVWRFL